MSLCLIELQNTISKISVLVLTNQKFFRGTVRYGISRTEFLKALKRNFLSWKYRHGIAVPTGGTAGAISIALAIAGEPLYSTIATVTPAAVENYFNVSVSAFIEVDRGCCLNAAVENVSAQAINLANPNLIIERVA